MYPTARSKRLALTAPAGNGTGLSHHPRAAGRRANERPHHAAAPRRRTCAEPVSAGGGEEHERPSVGHFPICLLSTSASFPCDGQQGEEPSVAQPTSAVSSKPRRLGRCRVCPRGPTYDTCRNAVTIQTPARGAQRSLRAVRSTVVSG